MVLRATIIKSLDLNREGEKGKKSAVVVHRKPKSHSIPCFIEITIDIPTTMWSIHVYWKYSIEIVLLILDLFDTIPTFIPNFFFFLLFPLPNLSKWNTNAQSVNEIIKMFNSKRYIWTRFRKKCVYLSFILSSSVLCFLHSFVILYLNLSIVANLSRCYLDSVQLLQKLERHKQFSI